MPKLNYTYQNNKNWVGEFQVGENLKVSGKLVYKKNYDFYLEILIHFDDKRSEDCSKNIKGYAVDQETGKAVYISLLNCSGLGANLSYRKFKIYFKYAVFTEYRNFEITENIDSINFFFNNWGEFNFPQGFKRDASPCYDNTISLDNEIDVGFCQNIQGNYLNENMAFDQLFFTMQQDGLSDEEKRGLSQNLKDVLMPYLDKIGIKDPETHEWCISLKEKISIEDLHSYQYYLKGLLTCLTYDFKTSIQKIIIKTKGGDGMLTHHYLLHQTDVKTDKINYNRHICEFNFGSFDKEEWKKIFNNLFSKKRLLDNFFFILQEDVRENRITPFHIARLMDCFGAMAENKKYTRKEKEQKYHKLLGDLLDGVEIELKNKVENYIDGQLEGIEGDKTEDNTKEKIRGRRLSNLRAEIVHFGQKSDQVIMQKAFNLHNILRLCVMDYVLEELSVSKEKRVKYKERIFKDFLN
ncbi:MAG: hypothetical protein ACJAS6_000247 [Rickettsiales bacterium]|jgi:hypothetical protein